MRINPYFELEGKRYEFKRTRWLIAEHRRLNEETPISETDKANLAKAGNLISDARKFAEKEKEWWEVLCEDPTPENKSKYIMFKEMSDDAISRYNNFIAANNSLQISAKRNIDILEQIAIKAIAEQYLHMDEHAAKTIWERFVEETDDSEVIVDWLNAMSECLFVEKDEVEDNGFLSEKRKMDEERANNLKAASRKRR